jgi:hypothetical protein
MMIDAINNMGWTQHGVRLSSDNKGNSFHQHSSTAHQAFGHQVVSMSDYYPRASIICNGASSYNISGHPDKNTVRNVTGTWMKVASKSDSLDEACDLVELPWVFRKALPFLNKLVLVDTETSFKTILKAGGIMDVVEEYSWSSDEEILHGRRDKRRGYHRGRVLRNENGFPCIAVSWDDPFSGKCTDTFEIVHPSGDATTGGPMELKQTTVMTVHGKKQIEYVTVYRRV